MKVVTGQCVKESVSPGAIFSPKVSRLRSKLRGSRSHRKSESWHQYLQLARGVQDHLISTFQPHVNPLLGSLTMVSGTKPNGPVKKL